MIIGIASADYLRKEKTEDNVPKWGGAGWARIGQYLPYLLESGHEVVCGTLWREHGTMVIDDDIIDRPKRVVPDVIILQRLMHEGIAEDVRKSRAMGQVFINDIDDWYWGLDPRNQAWAATHPKHNKEENTSFYSGNVGASDIITVSTPWLADICRQKWPSCDVRLLTNTVDVARFNPQPFNEGRPTLGWVGSTAHRSGDLEILRGVLGRAKTDYDLYHGGNNVMVDSFASRVGLEDEDVKTMPLTTADTYPLLLEHLDVGLIPLRDVPFNHAKSDIKGLEYAAAGIPFIATPTPSYASLHQEFKGHCKLAKKPKDWIKGFNYYKDPGNRQEDREALLDLVWKRDIKYGAQALLETIEGAV